MSRHHVQLDRGRMAVVRLAVLARDNWTCRHCGRWGNECDHIVPLDRGGAPYDPDNCQCLCAGCHIAKTQTENRRRMSAEREEWRDFLRATG